MFTKVVRTKEPTLSRITKLTTILSGSLVLILILSFTVGGQLEENNAFCQRCHVHDGIYKNFTAKKIKDLAGEHGKEEIKCINCHREPGLIGHASSFASASLALGRFLIGAYDKPIKTAHPPTNQVCYQCHSAQAKGELKLKGHYHSKKLLAQSTGKLDEAITCAKCHTMHDPAVKKTHWVNKPVAASECNRCHQAYDKEVEETGEEEEAASGKRPRT